MFLSARYDLREKLIFFKSSQNFLPWNLTQSTTYPKVVGAFSNKLCTPNDGFCTISRPVIINFELPSYNFHTTCHYRGRRSAQGAACQSCVKTWGISAPGGRVIYQEGQL